MKSLLTGILPLQMDGGKDINLRKLIASCVVIGGNALLYDLHDTELGVLNAQFYIDFVKKNIKSIMEAKTCFVPAITVDNEASQNCGICEATQGMQASIGIAHSQHPSQQHVPRIVTGAYACAMELRASHASAQTTSPC